MDEGHQTTSGPGFRADGGQYHRPVSVETDVGGADNNKETIYTIHRKTVETMMVGKNRKTTL